MNRAHGNLVSAFIQWFNRAQDAAAVHTALVRGGHFG